MAYIKKTWAQKMNPHTSARVEVSDRKYADIPLGSKVLIATPTIVEQYIRTIPKGEHWPIMKMRKELAEEYGAENTCPVTTGIFVRIIAENAYEQYEAGKTIDEIAPFWRMIDIRSPQTRRLSFGSKFLIERRIAEGLPENQYPEWRPGKKIPGY
jgi:hypothetical protein